MIIYYKLIRISQTETHHIAENLKCLKMRIEKLGKIHWQMIDTQLSVKWRRCETFRIYLSFISKMLESGNSMTFIT